MLNRPDTPWTNAENALRDLPRRVAAAAPANRLNTFRRLVADLRHHMDYLQPADVEIELLDVAQANGLTLSAKDDAEVRAIVCDVLTPAGWLDNEGQQDDGPPDDGAPPIDSIPDYAYAEPISEPLSDPHERTAPAVSPSTVQITPTALELRDPAQIAPRQFLYGRHYIRKFITATVAPGGMGKSSLVLGEALAMAAGKPIMGQPVRAPLTVWYWGGEDPAEETERRVAAICLQHGLTQDDIAGRLFCDSGRDLSIRLATLVRNQATIDHKLVEAMIDALRAVRADVLIIDPFVASHTLPENDNSGTDWLMKAGWSVIADRAGVAVELVHHVRKASSAGGQSETGIDDARGASALVGATRSVRLINTITGEQANAAGIPEDERWRYFRVDTGKTNMTARGGKSLWYRLVSVGLGNGLDDWPEDQVGVVEPWQMPNPFDAVQSDDLAKVQQEIGAGNWGESIQANDWAGHVIGKVMNFDTATATGKAKAKGLLDAWIKSGALRTDHRHDTTRGKTRPFVIVGVPA